MLFIVHFLDAFYEHIHSSSKQSLRMYVLVLDADFTKVIHEVKKKIDQWSENYYCILGRIWAKWDVGK